MRKTLLATIAASASLWAFGRTYYVDCRMADYTGHNGSSWELAYETIQEAINAASSGSEILVKPGHYNKGLGRKDSSQAGGHWWGNSRISATNKSLTIRSTDGASETFIEGYRQPEGFGIDCIRCADFLIDSSKTVILEGFTLTGGGTKASSDIPGHGAAVLCNSGSGAVKTTYLVDCVITDCTGYIDLVQGCTLVRTLVVRNRIVKSYASPAMLSKTDAICSIFAYNTKVDVNGVLQTDSVYFNTPCTFVNCSWIDNQSHFWNTAPNMNYNGLVSGSLLPTTDGCYSSGGVAVNRINDSTANRFLISPQTGDWRVRAGSGAVGAGDIQYLADEDLVPLPAGVDRFKDFYGNAIDPNAAEICAGAVQTTATPVGGAIAGNTYVSFGEEIRWHYDASSSYFQTTDYPCSVKVSCLAAKPNLQFTLTFPAGTSEKPKRPPSREDQSIYLVPPPTAGQVLSVGTDTQYSYTYVDCHTTDATGDQDGTEAHPYRTIQQAIDSIPGEHGAGIVLVKPGVYDEGGAKAGGESNPYARAFTGTKVIRVVSEQGPEKTVIVGAPDPNAADGFGPGAYMTAGGSAGTFQGFTLTGGYSGSTSFDTGGGRGSLYSYGQDVLFSDCIISNNFGKHASVGSGRFDHCFITGNTGGRAVLASSHLHSCLVRDNVITGNSGYVIDVAGNNNENWRNIIVDSTIIGDGVHGAVNESENGSLVLNSIIDNGAAPSATRKAVLAGNVFNGFSSYPWTSGFLTADPMLVDVGGDPAEPAMFAYSRGFGASVSATEDPTGRWWALTDGTDLHRRPRGFDANGRTMPGAIEGRATGGVYVAKGNGGTAVVSGGTFGLNAVAPGGSVTVGFAAGAPRPITGFLVDGVTNFFNESTSGEPTLTVTRLADEDHVIEPLYAEDATWYVDAVNGSDAQKYGYNPACAFRTLQAALTNPALAAGDTVMALPGTYDEGWGRQDNAVAVRSRAVVPDNVTLKSRDGAAATVIKGEASDVPDPLLTESQISNYGQPQGRGPNAMRCVWLKGDHSRLEGFTLAEGYTRMIKEDGTTGHGHVDTSGSGVFGGGNKSWWVVDCVFTNCWAFRGAGGYNGNYLRCRFYDCHAGYSGSATDSASNYSCLEKNCPAKQITQYAGFFLYTRVENCTQYDAFSCAGPTVNSVFLGNAYIYGTYNVTNKLRNCYFDASKGMGASLQTLIADGQEPGTMRVASDDFQFDDDGRPVIGRNVAIDAADEELTTFANDRDVLGGQRVYNGKLDLGALEADWRARYASDISHGRVSVSEASASVEESEGGKVKLVADARLRATVENRMAQIPCKVGFRIVGGGTLTLKLNGEVLETVSSEGEHEVEFRNGLASNELEFLFADGEGYAEIASVTQPAGTLLIFR